MRVTVVTETYPPEINGVSLTVRNMVESLANNHQVQLIRPRQGKGDQPAAAPNINVSLMPGLPVPKYQGLRFGLPLTGRISRILDNARPDAMYISTEGPLGWSALRAARQRGIPVLTGYHTRFDQYMSHYGIGVAQRGVAAYLRRFHNRASGTLTPTVELQQFLQREGYENVFLLPRAVDTQLFTPRRRSEELRSSWGLTDNDLAVIHVGRLAPEKNLGLAIAAFESIKQKHPRAKFVLIGDGPSRESLQQAHPDFIFRGQRLGADLAAHFASGDLFVFPSVTETFGNVVLEALASGTPVIGFDYAAAAQYITNGSNGFTVPLNDNDAFVRHAVVLAGLAGDLPDLHTAARQSVAHLQPSSVAAHLLELFADLQHEMAA